MAVILKDKLIHCLSVFNETGANPELKEILALLKKPTTIIPPDDDLNVLLFIFTLTAELPELMKHPKSESLRNFCLSLNPGLLSRKEKPGINHSSRH